MRTVYQEELVVDKSNRNITSIQDGGMAHIIETEGYSPTDDVDVTCLFVRFQSWDDNKEHALMNSLDGKKIRITIEVED